MHGSRDDAEDHISYEWIREYNYKVHNDEDHSTFWFYFDKGRVTFTDLDTKLSLFKRGKQATTQAFQRPSGVGPARSCDHLFVKTLQPIQSLP